MQRNNRGQILTDEAVTDDAKAFFVSVLSPDYRQYVLALGPFATKEAAESRVDDVRRYIADQNFKDHHWFAYGTCGWTGDFDDAPAGKFNDALGLVDRHTIHFANAEAV